jgi:hypothetical protein
MLDIVDDDRKMIYHWATRSEARLALMQWHKQELLDALRENEP